MSRRHPSRSLAKLADRLHAGSVCGPIACAQACLACPEAWTPAFFKPAIHRGMHAIRQHLSRLADTVLNVFGDDGGFRFGISAEKRGLIAERPGFDVFDRPSDQDMSNAMMQERRRLRSKG